MSTRTCVEIKFPDPPFCRKICVKMVRPLASIAVKSSICSLVQNHQHRGIGTSKSTSRCQGWSACRDAPPPIPSNSSPGEIASLEGRSTRRRAPEENVLLLLKWCKDLLLNGSGQFPVFQIRCRVHKAFQAVRDC